jgi:minimal PKS ketosynthase (KS/KS alpha)
MSDHGARTACVTGIGVVAPGRSGAGPFWELLVSGRTATGPVTRFDASRFRSRVAAECDFDPAASGLTPAEAERMDLYVQFAAAAAREALADAGFNLDQLDPWRVGVSMGTAVGGTTRLELDYVRSSDHGKRWVVDTGEISPYLHLALTPSVLGAEIAGLVGARGVVQTVSTGCTSGLDAVGYAMRLIEDGVADVMVAGASDSPISPIAMACFDAIKATSTRNDDPAHASRPFDLDRDGFVMGEGAAVLLLEESGHARRRGARVRAEVAGFATFGNAYHMTGLRREGVEMAAAISDAMTQAKLNPADIDYVNAHGSGTRQNDRHETDAVKRALGAYAYQVPMTSIKAVVGHSLGAIGSIELVACLLAMEHNVVPPTANLETPDPECDLDYVPKVARSRELDAVLSVGSGFGGFQSAVALRRPEVIG